MGSAVLHPSAVARPRLDSVDWLRGLVMVLMALDHVRDYFGDLSIDAVNPLRSNAPLFFTRWITHYCAPTFIFLAGVGAYLAGARGKSKAELSWFLFSRGLWIVILEETIVRASWGFDLGYHETPLGVLWLIGASMMILSALVYLPREVVLLLGLMLIINHNSFDDVKPSDFGRWGWVWNVLHVPARIEVSEGYFIGTGYTLIPWAGVMAVGYGFGEVFRWDRPRRMRWLVGLGLALTVEFAILRYGDHYGDPRPWRSQLAAVPGIPDGAAPPSPLAPLFAFLNCEKYPPSLCYLLMTLGPALLLLAAFDRPPGPLGKALVTFGRVPMFFYLLHLPLIVGAAFLCYSLTHPPAVDFLHTNGPPQGLLNFGLPAVYLAWLVIVTILYFPCRWFAGLKQRSRAAWLSYL